MKEHPLTGALLSYANETLVQLTQGASPAEQRANTAGWRAIWQQVPADDNLVLLIASAAQREVRERPSRWLLPIILEQLEEHFAQDKQYRRCAEVVTRTHNLRTHHDNMEMSERLLYSLSITHCLTRVPHPVRVTLDAATAEIARRIPEVRFPDQQNHLNYLLVNVRIDIEITFKST